ncbi:hypothetical protein BJX66DRAFT_345888 [Aspergillus keveii]|uniref:Uncharacterized protein n=1 Tax=Aspergillus keveii TaxID=714993 RepID=A0ABR4FGL5_9EURO
MTNVWKHSFWGCFSPAFLRAAFLAPFMAGRPRDLLRTQKEAIAIANASFSALPAVAACSGFQWRGHAAIFGKNGASRAPAQEITSGPAAARAAYSSSKIRRLTPGLLGNQTQAIRTRLGRQMKGRTLNILSHRWIS